MVEAIISLVFLKIIFYFRSLKVLILLTSYIENVDFCV